jgi:hypothetical protein
MNKVFSDLKIDGKLQYSKSPVDGYVLVTDQDGHASWTSPSAIVNIATASRTQMGIVEIGDGISVQDGLISVTMSNSGTGAHIYKGASGSVSVLKSIVGGSDNMSIVEGSDEISIDVVVGGIYQNNGNILYVSNNGSDSKPNRADHIGNPNLPYLTLDAAAAAALPNDIVYVFSGSYVATGNIARSGVSWHFEAGVSISKSSSGNLFDTTGHTAGFDITGHAKFVLTGSSGHFFNFAVNGLVYDIRCQSITCTAASRIFYIGPGGCSLNLSVQYVTSSGPSIMMMMFGTNGCSIHIHGISWKCTGGPVITGGWWYYTYLNVNLDYFGSTVATAVTYYNIGCRFNFNVSYIEGNWWAFESGDGERKMVNISCAYVSGISDTVLKNRYYVSGHCERYTGRANIRMGGCNQINILGGYCDVTFDIGYATSNWSLSISQSGGVSNIFITEYYYSVVFNVSGGIMNLNGNIMSDQVSNNSDRLISGGTLNLYGKFYYGAGLDSSYSGYSALRLQSGTLRVHGSIYNQGNDPKSVGIEWNGGNLIFEDSTIVTSNQYAHSVRSTSAGQVIKVTGRISTNRVERDGLLGGKYHIYRWDVASVQFTQVGINGQVYQESNMVTYDTTVKIASRMVQILSSVPGLFPYQDNPGLDPYFYVRSSTKGVTFTVQNGLNVWQSLVQLGSYPMSFLGNGLIICDSDIVT